MFSTHILHFLHAPTTHTRTCRVLWSVNISAILLTVKQFLLTEILSSPSSCTFLDEISQNSSTLKLFFPHHPLKHFWHTNGERKDKDLEEEFPYIREMNFNQNMTAWEICISIWKRNLKSEQEEEEEVLSKVFTFLFYLKFNLDRKWFSINIVRRNWWEGMKRQSIDGILIVKHLMHSRLKEFACLESLFACQK